MPVGSGADPCQIAIGSTTIDFVDPSITSNHLFEVQVILAERLIDAVWSCHNHHAVNMEATLEAK